jgi:hypothetical protein
MIKAGGQSGQIGLASGLVISPVCAIAGGIDGARDQIPIHVGRDASDIFGTSLDSSAIQAWLRYEVLRVSEPRNSYPLRFIPTPKSAASAPGSDSSVSNALTPDAKFIVTIKRVMLREASKSRETDPALPLVVEAEAVLHSLPNDERIAFIQVAHSGKTHPMSKWLADDAAQLNEGLRIASRALGERIYGQISNSSSQR